MFLRATVEQEKRSALASILMGILTIYYSSTLHVHLLNVNALVLLRAGDYFILDAYTKMILISLVISEITPLFT